MIEARPPTNDEIENIKWKLRNGHELEDDREIWIYSWYVCGSERR